MNINNLQIQLQIAVENAATEASADNTSATLYYLQLAKAINALNMGQIRTIDTVANLPTASTHEGWLYFVQADERLYYSNGVQWLGIVPIFLNQAWAWGLNSDGRLGDNTITNRSSPVSVIGGFTDWSQVSVGNTHSLAVRQNGTAWAWGSGVDGRLGDNTITNRSSPVQVVGGFTDWCQISAAGSFSLGVRTGGSAWAWGSSAQGQLGDNTTVNKSSPVQVVGGFTDWCQISAAGSFSLGVRTGGSAWAWGFNSAGQLGDNTTVNKSSPVLVAGGFTDWSQVAAGSSHSLGLRTNGTLWAWGCNAQGRLGDNTLTNQSSPVSVVGGFTDWSHVSPGGYQSLGVRQNGTLWAWGNNCDGRLGDNTTVNKSSPVSVIGGFTDWSKVSSGYRHSLAVRTNGTAWAWGYNGYAQLGTNNTTNRSSPVSVIGGFTDWSQVAAGSRNSLAIRSVAT